MGRRFLHGVTDSTSERAFAALARADALDGDVHLASAQSAGRGRLGRAWFSAPDEGLYASVVFLPPPPPWNPAAVTIAAGLALFDAVARLGLEGAQLKWPNDLVVGGAKLAGVLVETRGLSPARPHYVVGIGLNVRQRSFPAELERERAVTSLALCGLDLTLAQATEAVLEALAERRAQIGAQHQRLETDFVRALALAERPIEISAGEHRQRGLLRGFSIDAGVCLEQHDGRRRSFPLEHVRALSGV